jgi:hypothetical protein
MRVVTTMQPRTKAMERIALIIPLDTHKPPSLDHVARALKALNS